MYHFTSRLVWGCPFQFQSHISITLLGIMSPEDTVANYYLLKLFSLFSVFSISFLPCFFFLSDFYFCKLIVKSVKTEKKGVWAGRKWQRWSRLTSLRVCLGSVASNRENFTALSSNPESVQILFQLHQTNPLPLQSCTCCLLLLLSAQVQLWTWHQISSHARLAQQGDNQQSDVPQCHLCKGTFIRHTWLLSHCSVLSSTESSWKSTDWAAAFTKHRWTGGFFWVVFN